LSSVRWGKPSLEGGHPAEKFRAESKPDVVMVTRRGDLSLAEAVADLRIVGATLLS
jgi:hypothetical protein